MSKKNAPTDYRKQRKKEDRNMVLLVLFVLIVVAGVMIGIFLGIGEMIVALPCLMGGSLLIGGIWGGFTLLERYMDRNHE